MTASALKTVSAAVDPHTLLKHLGQQSVYPEPAHTEAPAEWLYATFAGRFCEISGGRNGAALTLVFRLVLEAQRQGEPAAWVTGQGSLFYPPDAADAGVDLANLAVVRAPDVLAAARAAEHLMRSGAFGLVVMDLGPAAHLPLHVQSRLNAQARQHNSAMLCITEKNRDLPSLGSLVSLRAHTTRSRERPNCFRCEADVIKDKRRGPGWGHVEVCRGPDGLR